MTPVPRSVVLGALNKEGVHHSALVTETVLRDLRDAGYHIVETPKLTETVPVHNIDDGHPLDRRWEDHYYTLKLSTLVDMYLLDAQIRFLDPDQYAAPDIKAQIVERLEHQLGAAIVHHLKKDRRAPTE
jgi:hypothetical protein